MNTINQAVYGYIRVSTKEQNEERQVIALRESGVTDNHIFMDKQSGKDFDRPQYLQEMKILKNDGWAEVAGFEDRFYVDKHNPRVEVEIYEEGNEDDEAEQKGTKD